MAVATQTPVLNLTKPEYTDSADVADINGNMDILDEAVGNSVSNIATNGTSYTVTKTDGTTFTFSLANSGVTAGSYGPSADVVGNEGTTISVPQVTVDAKGRVTSVVNRTYTSKNTSNAYTAGTGLSLSNNQFSLADSGATAGSYGPSANVTGNEGATINVPQITVDAKGRITSIVNRVYTSKNTDTTYSAASGGGLSLSGTAFSLANSGVTAGSYGPSANATPSYGTTFNVPYLTVDAKGRVTAASTKTVKIPASDNTNTWRGIQNVLTSTSTTDSLSANMGKKLQDEKVPYTKAGDIVIQSTTGSIQIKANNSTGAAAMVANGYNLTLQSDGNLVLRNAGGTAIWQTGTSGK